MEEGMEGVMEEMMEGMEGTGSSAERVEVPWWLLGRIAILTIEGLVLWF